MQRNQWLRGLGLLAIVATGAPIDCSGTDKTAVDQSAGQDSGAGGATRAASGGKGGLPNTNEDGGGAPSLDAGSGGTRSGSGGQAGSTGGTKGTGGAGGRSTLPDSSVVEPEPEAGATAACGNGHLDPGEQCDDHNTTDGDGCTSACNATCEACELTAKASPVLKCSDAMDACYKSTDNSAGGPSPFVSKAQLCEDVVRCLRTTKCGAPPMDPGDVVLCYAGLDTTVADFFGNPTAKAHGPCQFEMEAAGETTDKQELSANIADQSFALGRAMRLFVKCDRAKCSNECFPAPDGG